MTPEEAIETGIYNRLTDATDGITVEAGKYCATPDTTDPLSYGGVQLYQGQVDLTADAMIEWGRVGVGEGPIVLIVAGDDVKAETDHADSALSTYTVRVFIATASYRTPHEGLTGDPVATRKPGIWQVKQDILDRLLNHIVVTTMPTLTWSSGRLITVEQSVCLYEMTFEIIGCATHEYVPWTTRDDLTKIRTTFTKQPSAVLPADDLIVEVDSPGGP